MVGSNTSSNLFNLSDNAINALRKLIWFSKLSGKLRGKVIIDSDLQNYCDQISSLSETITKLATTNQQINIELTIIKVANSKLKKRVADLQKNRLSRNSVAGGIINWKIKSYRFAVSRVLRLIRMTLWVVIVSLLQDSYSRRDK